MKSFEVTGRDKSGCMVKHVVKAHDEEGAKEKFRRAHPHGMFKTDLLVNQLRGAAG